ncbi:MAG: hypothetical protein R3335_08760 [Anaerolineales bacterium]|nr:hypothetical protein [Anaerolineales bacterium]
MDRYLRVHLKRWAKRETPPEDGLARLLWSAAVQQQPDSLSRLDIFLRWLKTEKRGEDFHHVPESLLNQAKIFSLQLNMVSVY